MSARCRRAIGPVSTVKRAPEILPAAAKSTIFELLAELDVIARLEVEMARLAPATQLDVRGLVASVRHALVQHVRQAEHQLVELRLHLGELSFRLRRAAHRAFPSA